MTRDDPLAELRCQARTTGPGRPRCRRWGTTFAIDGGDTRRLCGPHGGQLADRGWIQIVDDDGEASRLSYRGNAIVEEPADAVEAER